VTDVLSDVEQFDEFLIYLTSLDFTDQKGTLRWTALFLRPEGARRVLNWRSCENSTPENNGYD
jgi:hypothetical protein